MMNKTCSNPDCGKKIRRAYLVNGKPYCYTCYTKNFSIIPSTEYKPRISLSKALDRVYVVKGYMKYKDKDTIQAEINVPTILIGKKVKLVLIEE